jgi:magnesium transporter
MPGLGIEDHLSDPITRHMRRDFSCLRVEQTVAEALDGIRRKPPEGRIIYFYVVDRDNRLRGVVPTRRLLLAPLDHPLGEVMIQEVIAIPDSASVLDACEFFTLHRLLAFPVVDRERRIVGIVDVELYTQELADLDRSQSSEDLFQLIGVHVAASQQASPLASFRSRFPWLLCNIGGGLLAALVSGLFEAELQRVVAVALFIPVVLALAESVTIQSVSLALQLLHGQKPTLRGLLWKLRRELVTGLFLGVASGFIIGAVALLWLGQARLMLCLLGGIAGGVAVAAAIGVAMPNLLRMFRRNPHVAAGPIALAVADMITLLIYFNLARWLFG